MVTIVDKMRQNRLSEFGHVIKRLIRDSKNLIIMDAERRKK